MYRKLRKYTLYVVRINANNELTESKPCAECQKFLEKYFPGKIVYSSDNGELVKVRRASDLNSTHLSHYQRKYNPRK